MSEEQTITLKHPLPNGEDHIIKLDPLAMRDGKWLERVLILPWTTPTRMIGFIHPADEQNIDVNPFMLFATFSYYASVGMQPVGENKMRVAEGPKAVLPVDLVGPIDLRVGKNCPTWMFLRDQGDEWKNLLTEMLLKQIMPPPLVEAPPTGLVL